LRQLPAADQWDILREKINQIAQERGEAASYPMPIEHLKLVVEPRHPMYDTLNGFAMPEDDQPAPAYSGVHAASGRRKLHAREIDAMFRWMHWMKTLAVAASPAWSVDAECRAIDKLRSLVTEQAFKCYFTSGMFLETSPRSRVTYMFRKLRPTVALRPNEDGNFVPIAFLCLHPLAYYEQSWAGSMVPTDDVVAHLMLMRGDEARFWRKSNHHSIADATAGV
jgi:hypothetical protein